MDELVGGHGLGHAARVLAGILREHGADHEFLRAHVMLVQAEDLLLELFPQRRDPRPCVLEGRGLVEQPEHA